MHISHELDRASQTKENSVLNSGATPLQFSLCWSEWGHPVAALWFYRIHGKSRRNLGRFTKQYGD